MDGLTLVTYYLPDDGGQRFADVYRDGAEVVIEVSSDGIAHRASTIEELDAAIEKIVAWEPVPDWDPDDTHVDGTAIRTIRSWFD